MKLASIIAAEGDTEAAELLATAFGKAGEGLVRFPPALNQILNKSIRKYLNF